MIPRLGHMEPVLRPLKPLGPMEPLESMEPMGWLEPLDAMYHGTPGSYGTIWSDRATI